MQHNLIKSGLFILALNSLLYSSFSISILKANESELLSVMSLQSTSLPQLQQMLKAEIHLSNKFRAIPGLFSQQNGVTPTNGSKQLPSFGALQPWSDILNLLDDAPNRILLVMVRHGEAWENVNPYSNDVCEFDYNGETIQNFDSALDFEGIEQCHDLNYLLHEQSNDVSNSRATWFETMGLTHKPFFSSPLTRTLQTINLSFKDLPMGDVTVTEMIRASIGTDVCNYRRSVNTLTSDDELPSPWNTNCTLPKESLADIYRSGKPDVNLHFTFPIRPAGGDGMGLISNAEMLWRSDVVDTSHVDRSKTFLAQLFSYLRSYDTQSGTSTCSPIAGVVTHGEMIDAIYQSVGIEAGYSALNTQVVPVMVELA